MFEQHRQEKEQSSYLRDGKYGIHAARPGHTSRHHAGKQRGGITQPGLFGGLDAHTRGVTHLLQQAAGGLEVPAQLPQRTHGDLLEYTKGNKG